MPNLVINERLEIPMSELIVTAVRSQGPGGQNVNKVNSKIVLQWNVAETPSLPHHVRRRLILSAGSLVSKSGWLTITSQKTRYQIANREDCYERLRAMILEAFKIPKPRQATRPTKASKRRRLKTKQINSQKKQLRRSPKLDS